MIVLETAAVVLCAFSASFLCMTVASWSIVMISKRSPEQIRVSLVVTVLPALISIGFGVLAIAVYTLRNAKV